MKRVLIIAYYFPPSGGPGVQRVLHYVKYLPDFGWQPVVLTVENGDFPARDETLLAEIPAEVPVIRTKIIEPYRLYRRLQGLPPNAPVDVNVLQKSSERQSWRSWLIQKIRETLFIPDARIGWFPFARRAALQLLRRYRIEALYTSAPPYTTAVIGLSVKRRSNIPWVAGFRDPWTGFLSAAQRWGLPAWIERRLEKAVLQNADAVECAWKGIVRDFRQKYPEIPEEKFVVIPNGFHPEISHPVPYQPNAVFTMRYVGSLYGRRDPQPLLRALEQLVQQRRIDPERFQLHIVGRVGEDVRRRLQRAPVPVAIEPYVPFRESVRRLQSADALLLIVDDSPHSRDIVPGKLFEYLAVHRPVVAIGPPDSEVGAILEETQAGQIIAPDQIDLLADALATLYRAWETDRMSERIAQIRTEAVQRYSRYHLTHRFAQVLDTVVAANRTAHSST